MPVAMTESIGAVRQSGTIWFRWTCASTISMTSVIKLVMANARTIHPGVDPRSNAIHVREVLAGSPPAGGDLLKRGIGRVRIRAIRVVEDHVQVAVCTRVRHQLDRAGEEPRIQDHRHVHGFMPPGVRRAPV